MRDKLDDLKNELIEARAKPHKARWHGEESITSKPKLQPAATPTPKDALFKAAVRKAWKPNPQRPIPAALNQPEGPGVLGAPGRAAALRRRIRPPMSPQAMPMPPGAPMPMQPGAPMPPQAMPMQPGTPRPMPPGAVPMNPELMAKLLAMRGGK